jgi:DNA (cytosine-5)-methyltransferase 1
MIKEDKSLLKNYKFIDLFSGIGGFHLALSSYGAECVFASEWDKYASNTYQKNFGIKPYGDITKIEVENIPPHDILCGGFPCQAFSISGKQKGFEDTRGTLFFDIARIVNYHQPKVLFLENVKNLLKHDNGNTLRTITETLQELNYSVFYKVLNSSHFGLPQNRERLYIVAFHNALNVDVFQFPKPINTAVCLEQILENNPGNAKIITRNDIEIYRDYAISNSLFSDFELLNKPIQIGKVNKGGQGERIYHPLGHAITLSAYGGGVGAKTGLYLITQAYKQFGNSVSVNVLQYILNKIAPNLQQNNTKTKEKSKLKYA